MWLSPSHLDTRNDFLLIENLRDDNGELKFPNNKLTVFDRWGQVVLTIEGYDNTSGKRWEGQNENGDLVPPGTYFYAFQANEKDFYSGFIIVNYK